LSEIKQKAIAGYFWQALRLVGERGITLIAYIVFARFLTPEDLGTFAIASLVYGIVSLVFTGGITPTFIAWKGEVESAKPTVFWLSFVVGLGAGLALFGISGWLGAVFTSPESVPLLRVLCGVLVVESFRIVPHGMLWRDLRLKEAALADTAGLVVGAIVGVASLGVLPPEHREWAPGLMLIVRLVLSSLLFFLKAPYVPPMRISFGVVKPFASQAAFQLSANGFIALSETMNRLILGVRSTNTAVGHFQLGSNITQPAGLLAAAARWTLFPVFAHAGTEQQARDFVLRGIRVSVVLAVGLLGWLILAVPDAVPLIFGERWRPTVVLAQWLSVAGLFRLYSYLASTTLQALNRAWVASFMWLGCVLLGGALLFGVPLFGEDALPIAVVTAVYDGITALAGILLLWRCLGIALGDLISAMLPVWVSLAGGLVLGAVPFAFAGLEGFPWVRLGLVTFLFALGYLPLCGKLLGGTYFSLLTPGGIRALIRES
jgi:O-antigen/teichoic acid export membrane protein